MARTFPKSSAVPPLTPQTVWISDGFNLCGIMQPHPRAISLETLHSCQIRRARTFSESRESGLLHSWHGGFPSYVSLQSWQLALCGSPSHRTHSISFFFSLPFSALFSGRSPQSSKVCGCRYVHSQHSGPGISLFHCYTGGYPLFRPSF